MYAINPTSRNTLITPDECTAKMANTALDSKKWAACIEVAETKYVLPVLGWAFYNDLCDKKNVVVTSSNIAALQAIFTAQFGTQIDGTTPQVILTEGMIVNSPNLASMTTVYTTLWNQALWNFVFNCVYLVALPENYAQFSNSGVQKSNPLDSAIGEASAKSVGITLNDLKFLDNNKLLDRVNPSQTYLEWFLCANKGDYPLLPSDTCEKYSTTNTDGTNGLTPARPSTFINIYEDDDCNNRRRCCGYRDE